MTYQLETYEDIGAMFRDVRLEYGWKIAEAARLLNLRKAYVEALEEGRLEDLPGMAYARGYIRNYALLLGLDADKILSSFEAVGPHRASMRFIPHVKEEMLVPRGWVIGLPLLAALAGFFLWSGDDNALSESGEAVKPVPAELEAQYLRRQEQVKALPGCFVLPVSGRDALCYYQRKLRRTVWRQKRQFSTELAPRTVFVTMNEEDS